MKRKPLLLLSALVLTLLASHTPVIAQNAPLTTLHAFSARDGEDNPDGAFPVAALTRGRDGNFYGTAAGGGRGGHGTVFKLTPAGAFTTLHSFTGTDTDGASPQAGLVQGRDGNFYGTTYGVHNTANPPPSTIFQITPSGVLTTLHQFNNADGEISESGLIEGSDGNFYGTTGASGYTGTVFQITPAGAYRTLAHLDIFAWKLAQGSDGNFYGVTEIGGVNHNGTIFKVTPAGALTTLHVFSAVNKYDQNLDGAQPYAGLVRGSDGNFYGTTYVGGSNVLGTVFKITPAGVLTTLHNFPDSDTDGAHPTAELIQGSDGNLYGTTYGDGHGSGGSIFLITPAGAYTNLYNFVDGAKGENPLAGLVQGGDGNFYGTTEFGGSAGNGTVFVFGAGKPVILSPATAKGTLGTRFTYQIAASGVPTRYAVDGMGGETHVDASTGLISGMPLGVGTHTLTLHAFNAQGEGTQTLALTIDKEAPVITSPATASAVEGQPFSYQITADNAPTQFQVLRLIPDLHVDAKAGLISGTPTTASGTFRLTLKAVNGQGTGTQILQLSVAPP